MRHLFRALLLALLVVFLTFALPTPAGPSPQTQAPFGDTTSLPSVVRLQLDDEQTFCSGFVINTAKRLVMTADHCLQGASGHRILVQGQEVREIFHIPSRDVSILEVSGTNPLPPPLQADPSTLIIESQVQAYGFANGQGLRRVEAIVVFPDMVLASTPEHLVLLSPVMVMGMSGGPVLQGGKVVGIVMAGRDKPSLSVVFQFAPTYELTQSYWELPVPAPIEAPAPTQ